MNADSHDRSGCGHRVPPPPEERAAMTRWYNPLKLARTGVDVAVATLMSRQSDARLVEALSAAEQDQPYCYDDGDELWIDFVADTGDGWNSTYAVARSVAEGRLELDCPGGDRNQISAKRGRILVFGGDQVYPVASRNAYRLRLENVYRTAYSGTPGEPPEVFAIPGNHDWYDGLAAFSRLFCTQRKFATCPTRQSRSYFALRLPQNWWLFGVDVQLGSDLDGPQVDYFRKVVDEGNMEGGRVILCTAEPHWVYAAQSSGRQGCDESNLRFVESELLKGKGSVRVLIAGDLHHYVRYDNRQTGVQRVTAGGGGAFLHPTHRGLPDPLKDGSRLATRYPTTEESSRLCRRNLWFPLLNFWFGLVTAIVYLLTAWWMPLEFGDRFGLSAVIHASRNAILRNPAVLCWFALLLICFVLFTDVRFPRYRCIGGAVHGLAHIVAALCAQWVAAWFGVGLLGMRCGTFFYLLVSSGCVFVLGWLLGAWIMGVYLYISLTVFGCHPNEAFSSLRVADFKNFLRMHIDGDGVLTIFAIGLDRVPRRWKEGTRGNGAPTLVPDGPEAGKPRLIEVVRLAPDGGEGPGWRAHATVVRH